MNTPNDAQMALLAKARAARVPSSIDFKSKFNLLSPTDAANDNHHHHAGAVIKSEKGADVVTHKQSWHEAAKNVNFTPRTLPYPRLHEFEKLILPSLQTLRAQFICDICPHCQRPIIESILSSIHIDACRKRKEEAELKLNGTKDTVTANVNIDDKTGDISTKRKRKTGTTVDSAGSDSKTAPKNIHNNSNNAADDVYPSKKLKASAKSKESKSTRIAKQSRQPKQTRQPKEKPSVVYNPDKNCGVLMPNGQPCMRSLTCKQHPMGAKRAVVGRTAPYDILLSNYHRQHQMKQAQLTASAAQAAQLESDQLQEQQAQQNPEKEVGQVFEGVRRALRAPLATNDSISSSTSLRLRNFRLREMLSVALLPRRLPPTGGVLYGRSIAFPCNNPDSYRYVRSQAVQQAVYITQIQQRQQLLQQQQEAAASTTGSIARNQQAKVGIKAGTPVTSGVNMPLQQQQQQPNASQKQLQQAQQAYHMQQAQSVRIQAQQRLKQIQKLKDPYNLG